MKRCAIAVATALACASLAACGGSPPPPRAQQAPAEPHWQDVLDTTPDLLVVVRAKAMREDRVYGPFLRRVLDLARTDSKALAGTRVMDAMSDAEELVLAVRTETADAPGERLFVARGVRADIDPATLVDDDGHALWGSGPAGNVRELARDRDEHGHAVDASLFELPGRTWVIAQGPARARAREAFAHPFGRPPVAFDPRALAVARFDGPALVRHLRILQDLGALAEIGRHLRSLTLTLSSGAEHTVTGTFVYVADDDAAAAEVAARGAIGTLSRRYPTLAWLGSARVDHVPKTVSIAAPLPAQLVGALLNAGQAPDLDLPPSP